MSSNISKAIDNFVNDLGDSLSYWTSYLTSVKRGPILQESAIRYAISEFLEVNKHNDNGSPIIERYLFEQPHPYLKGKHTDLFLRAEFPQKDTSSYVVRKKEQSKKDQSKDFEPIEFYIEFKYVRDATRDTNGGVYKDYVRDLCRLFSISKNDANSTKCFFVVVGEFFSFYDNFYSIQKKKSGRKPKNNQEVTKDIARTFRMKGQYGKLLPFTYKEKNRKVNIIEHRFIVNAISDAEQQNSKTKNTKKRDTSFFRLGIEDINELRRESVPPKDDIQAGSIKNICSNDSINVRLVFSNLFSKTPRNNHPDTIVCIWEVSSK